MGYVYINTGFHYEKITIAEDTDCNRTKNIFDELVAKVEKDLKK